MDRQVPNLPNEQVYKSNAHFFFFVFRFFFFFAFCFVFLFVCLFVFFPGEGGVELVPFELTDTERSIMDRRLSQLFQLV